MYLLNGELLAGSTGNLPNDVSMLIKPQFNDLLQGELSAGVIKWSLHLLLELIPVAITHGRILHVLDERHGPLEGVNAPFQMSMNSPVFVLCGGEAYPLTGQPRSTLASKIILLFQLGE